MLRMLIRIRYIQRWQKTGKRETVTVSAALPKSFRNFPS